jgi:hypothetical protein
MDIYLREESCVGVFVRFRAPLQFTLVVEIEGCGKDSLENLFT